VTDVPETYYIRSADGTTLAYQVTGSGPLDLAFAPGNPSPIDLLWDDAGVLRLSKRLGTFSRTVWFEPRGFGASEGDARDSLVGGVFDADVAAVLDGTGCEQVAFVGWGIHGGSAIHFSITHPELVSALILFNTYAHYVREDDYPFGVPPESLDQRLASVRAGWGTGDFVEVVAPSRSTDQRFRAWLARNQRVGRGPDQIASLTRAGFERDVRSLLSSVSVPTLVLHREGDRYIELGAGRWLAEHIPGAKFVVLPGEDHIFFVGDTDALVDEIEEFLTGARSGSEGEVRFAALLFTDIVASTEYQARVGPREWSRLTDQHDALVRAALTRHRGHEVKTTGDGFLATFDATGRTLRCAAEIFADAEGIGLELRAGVHIGEVETRGDDLGGLAVNIAKRICDLAEPGQVLVSETVRSLLVGSGVEFRDRGKHQLKGVPGTWRLYAPAN
jgi:class 3 adenylate cyclase/pimeloyl-ACP methyl ester carboxylesterase